MAVQNIYTPTDYLGPLKKYGTSTPESFNGYETGWFYPLYITREEAIQADKDRNGKGVYRVVSFYNTEGEFYLPNSFANTGMLKDPLIYKLYEGPGAENPFKRIQKRLSVLVENQLPDFVQTDYTTFVTFIKAYYEYLEQNNKAQEVLQDITKYADIDTTSEELVSKFIQNYANDFYQTRISSNRLLAKRIREIYSKKGTEEAYKILFYILYKETIEFFYPYDVTLKVSSGKWSNQKVLRVKQTNDRQNIFDFENTEIVGSKTNSIAVVNKVLELDLQGNKVFELILDTTSIKGNFVRDELVTATKTVLLTGQDFSTTSLTAEVYSIISNIDIVDGGLGYTKGFPVTISDSSGILAKAEVNNVNRFGTITAFNVKNPGINYSNSTVITIDPPTSTIEGKYSIKKGVVTVTFSNQTGLVRGKNIQVYYYGNVFSPVDNTSHTASVVSTPNLKSIRFRYPGT